MDLNLVSNIESCYVVIPHLLYYSHIPTAIVAFVLGFFVFFKNRNSETIVSKMLLFVSIFFAIWSLLDMLLWISVDSRIIAFIWSIINLVEMLVSVGTLYFAYVFLEKKDAPLKYKMILGALLLPFIILIPTRFNIPGFD